MARAKRWSPALKQSRRQTLSLTELTGEVVESSSNLQLCCSTPLFLKLLQLSLLLHMYLVLDHLGFHLEALKILQGAEPGIHHLLPTYIRSPQVFSQPLHCLAVLNARPSLLRLKMSYFCWTLLLLGNAESTAPARRCKQLLALKLILQFGLS